MTEPGPGWNMLSRSCERAGRFVKRRDRPSPSSRPIAGGGRSCNPCARRLTAGAAKRGRRWGDAQALTSDGARPIHAPSQFKASGRCRWPRLSGRGYGAWALSGASSRAETAISGVTDRETHLSAQQARPQAAARLPRAPCHEGRPQGSRTPPGQGPQAPLGLSCALANTRDAWPRHRCEACAALPDPRQTGSVPWL